jgi:hypothetical protein
VRNVDSKGLGHDLILMKVAPGGVAHVAGGEIYSLYVRRMRDEGLDVVDLSSNATKSKSCGRVHFARFFSRANP